MRTKRSGIDVYATRHDPRIVMNMFTTKAVTGISSPIEQITEMVLSHSGTGAPRMWCVPTAV